MKEYAIYKGDTFLFVGQAKECAEYLGVSTDTIWHYASPSYLKKMEKLNRHDSMIVVKLDDEIEE